MLNMDFPHFKTIRMNENKNKYYYLCFGVKKQQKRKLEMKHKSNRLFMKKN